MPKLKISSSKDLAKLIEKSGFILDHITGSHHVFYHNISKKRVVVPMHNKDLPIGTILPILKMAVINKEYYNKEI